MRALIGVCCSAIAVAIGVTSCTKKETDEERLRRKLDVTNVHLYAGAKATLAEDLADEKIRAARDILLKLMLSRLREDGSKSWQAAAGELSPAELARLGGLILQIRGRGATIVREGKEHRPVLPVLLAPLREPSIDKLTTPSEHALLMSIYLLARFHPRLPVPIPEELILFEASRTDAARLERRELAVPVRVFKTYVLARNELCDMAVQEAKAVRSAPASQQDLAAALKLLRKEPMSGAAVGGLSAGLEGLTEGAVAICYLQRGEDKKARESLHRLIDAAQRAGLKDHGETELLRAYLDCSEGKAGVQAGRKRLEGLSKRSDLSSAVKQDLPLFQRYCDASSTRISLARLLVGLAVVHAEQAGITAELEKSRLYRIVHRFGVATGSLEELSHPGGRLQQVGKAAGGIWDKLRGKKKGSQ